MPCDQKIHKVDEKWERRRKREQEEAERQRKLNEPTLVPNWPTRAPVKKPADA